MARLVALVLLIAAAIWLIRRAWRRVQQEDDARQKPAVEGELVRCARCGVHLPRSEAREVGDALYCSEEHARLGPAAR
ncbi:MAG: PP0621 family protein [Vulcanimicrobiaceae bacterium]